MSKYLFIIIIAGICISANAQNTDLIEKLDSAKTPDVFLITNGYTQFYGYKYFFNFQIPDSSDVRIKIVNVAGDTVRTLSNEILPGGYYKARWDFKDDCGKFVSSGVYWIHFKANCNTIKTHTKKYSSSFKWIVVK
jgi:hypothetical protein